MQYIDFHCDTLMQAFMRGDSDIFSLPYAMADIKRLKKGNAMGQFFAIFLPPPGAEKIVGHALPEDDEYIASLVEILENSVKIHPDEIQIARNEKELCENNQDGKISAFLTIEDGRSVNGDIEKLEQYAQLGIRLISLTWNMPNCMGFPNSRDAEMMSRGLTSFGKESVERMGELGMLVDVSHLSDGGFFDMAECSTVPFVASHSNCRELSPHPRNLTNEMIKVLAEQGGVAGLNFGPEFLNLDITKKESRMKEMAAHVRHMIQYGGEECVAIGTDFDGIHGDFEIGSPSQMPLFFQYLEQNGFSQGLIEKIAYKNIQRVIKDVLI